MTPRYAGDGWEIYCDDCREVMATLDAESIDSIVCDPPYGLSFMGKEWDHGVPGEKFWAEALRVAKPGAHLLAFGGTRTYHRLACAIEDAGWEIRDCVMWVYGSGFPKSHDVSKAIDKAAGAEREVVGVNANSRPSKRKGGAGFDAAVGGEALGDMPITAPATPEAQQWAGWGTALKPAWEPIIVARKPLCGTVAENMTRHGTGGINVNGCRVRDAVETWPASRSYQRAETGSRGQREFQSTGDAPAGRWPANLIHDGSDEVLGLFPSLHGAGFKQLGGNAPNGGTSMFGIGKDTASQVRHGDSGSAARFFYCAKASKADRDEGCEGMEERDGSVGDRRPSGSMSQRIHADEGRPDTKARNHHPTVKPTDLMRYLCRLVTPPGGIILDPFTGSGSTGKAAIREGFRFAGIEIDETYAAIASRRIPKPEADKRNSLPFPEPEPRPVQSKMWEAV